MSHYHAVVWMDHSQARVFFFNADDVDLSTVRSHQPDHHLHHKAGCIGSGKAPLDAAFFQSIAAVIQDAGEVLVGGPGLAKLEFMNYVQRHEPSLESKVSVETLDHPTDRQIVAHARRYFRAADRMRPQT